MTIKIIKKKCDQILEGVPGLVEELTLRYNSRSDRWQRSDKGRNMRTDIRMLRELRSAVQTFSNGLEEEE